MKDHLTTTFTDILHAQKRLRPHLMPTPVEEAPWVKAWLKLENVNITHAFKVRGALNAILALPDSERAKGVIACSAGNHSQGIAYAAWQSGIPATVVMPKSTPQKKVEGAKRYQAKIILHGDIYDEAEIHAHQLAQEQGLNFVSPYNDRQVVAGQGTIALELFAQIPDLARVIVPTSGGGLIAGIGLVCKTMNPNCEVIGVQSIATPAMYNYFYDTDHPQQATLAEGLAGDIEDGAITLALCRNYVDKIVLVEEAEIEDAIRWLIKHHGWIVEGAGAVGVAALLTQAIEADNRPTALIISGGNIDYDVVKRLL